MNQDNNNQRISAQAAANTLAEQYNTNFRQDQQTRQAILKYANDTFFSQYRSGTVIDTDCGNGTLTNELAGLLKPLKVK